MVTSCRWGVGEEGGGVLEGGRWGVGGEGGRWSFFMYKHSGCDCVITGWR